MVTAQDRDSLGVTNFEADEKRDGLDRVVATINVVTHEQIVVVRQLTANIEQLLQIVKLTVYVSANGDGCAHLRYIALILEYVLGMFGEIFDVFL